MLYLVWKDLLLTKKISIIVLSLYAVFISLLANKMPILPEILYGFCILIFVYLTTVNANNYDEKSNSEVILNSLPIARKDIVKGKYLSTLLHGLMSGLVIILSTNLFQYSGFLFITRTAGILDLILSLSIITLVFSFYYPIYFKLERDKRTILNTALYMMIFFMPPFLLRFLEKTLKNIPIEGLASFNRDIMILSLFIACIFIYYLSYLLSKTLYIKRDF